eukprot:6191378-Pleurochrysis_carterae.AAC.1
MCNLCSSPESECVRQSSVSPVVPEQKRERRKAEARGRARAEVPCKGCCARSLGFSKTHDACWSGTGDK